MSVTEGGPSVIGSPHELSLCAMRAEYLEGSGPMRELHSLPEDPAEVVEAEGQKQVDVNSDPGASGRDNSTRQFGIFKIFFFYKEITFPSYS